MRWADLRAEFVERAGGQEAIEASKQGKVSGQEVLARYADALGGRLHHAIYFDDGDIAAIA